MKITREVEGQEIIIGYVMDASSKGFIVCDPDGVAESFTSGADAEQRAVEVEGFCIDGWRGGFIYTTRTGDSKTKDTEQEAIDAVNEKWDAFIQDCASDGFTGAKAHLEGLGMTVALDVTARPPVTITDPREDTGFDQMTVWPHGLRECAKDHGWAG